jgi:cell division protein FtsB
MRNNGGAAGRRPGAKRPAPTRTQRSRAASPTRRAPKAEVEQVGRQTALTARAAILVVAVASVMLAVAVPLKIWLGQRSDISKVASQIQRTEAHVHSLAAQDQRWNDPGYVESQARQRLHYVLPGEKTYIVLGKGHGLGGSGAKQRAASSNGPWYSQFWQSDQTAGNPPTSGK